MSAQQLTIRLAGPSRAGIAVVAAIVALWAGAVAVEFATDTAAEERKPAPTRVTDGRGTWPAWPGSSYVAFR